MRVGGRFQSSASMEGLLPTQFAAHELEWQLNGSAILLIMFGSVSWLHSAHSGSCVKTECIMPLNAAE